MVYGSREFKDALLELRNLSLDLGFSPVAAAASIGEYSFVIRDIPIASGRPDSKVVQTAINFGIKIRKKTPA